MSRLRLHLLALSLFAAFPAMAQTPEPSDLQALRFYHTQGNAAAATAELRRLMQEFPTWIPPEDLSALFKDRSEAVTERILRLIETGSFDAARAAIADTTSADPGWAPPADLLDYLRLAEGQAEFDAARSTEAPERVIGIARGIPALIACDRIGNVWDLASAHRALGEDAAALDVYRAILRTCSKPDELVATLQKADEIASLEAVGGLSDIAQRNAPAAAPALRMAEDGLRAGRGAPLRWANTDRIMEPRLAASPTATLLPSPPPASAAAVSQAPAAKAQPEVVATSPAAKRPSVTSPSVLAGQASAVQRAAQRGAWAECLRLSDDATTSDAVLQRGWCAYNVDRLLDALAAFRYAAAQAPGGEARRDANYGLLLTLLRLEMTEDAARLAAQVPLTRVQRVEIEGQILAQRGVAAYERLDLTSAVAFFRAHTELTGVTRRDLALLEGYALLRLDDREAARAIFEGLHRDLATEDTRRALRSLE